MNQDYMNMMIQMGGNQANMVPNMGTSGIPNVGQPTSLMQARTGMGMGNGMGMMPGMMNGMQPGMMNMGMGGMGMPNPMVSGQPQQLGGNPLQTLHTMITNLQQQMMGLQQKVVTQETIIASLNQRISGLVPNQQRQAVQSTTQQAGQTPVFNPMAMNQPQQMMGMPQVNNQQQTGISNDPRARSYPTVATPQSTPQQAQALGAPKQQAGLAPRNPQPNVQPTTVTPPVFNPDLVPNKPKSVQFPKTAESNPAKNNLVEGNKVMSENKIVYGMSMSRNVKPDTKHINLEESKLVAPLITETLTYPVSSNFNGDNLMYAFDPNNTYVNIDVPMILSQVNNIDQALIPDSEVAENLGKDGIASGQIFRICIDQGKAKLPFSEVLSTFGLNANEFLDNFLSRSNEPMKRNEYEYFTRLNTILTQAFNDYFYPIYHFNLTNLVGDYRDYFTEVCRSFGDAEGLRLNTEFTGLIQRLFINGLKTVVDIEPADDFEIGAFIFYDVIHLNASEATTGLDQIGQEARCYDLTEEGNRLLAILKSQMSHTPMFLIRTEDALLIKVWEDRYGLVYAKRISSYN